ncbi:hypothetical protein AMST5_01334 [freshwater sediment metagenome]|uniref:Uracil-DNA glycosylase-like domain-containing protein n=1 Tax=freshwater sediment metagenome TaxID=556182 RepID=A0AA48RDK6_9ZZZZ
MPMSQSLFTVFAPLLRTITESELRAEIAQPQRLLIESADFRGKKLDVAFAPFDYVNPAAQIVIVGLTPGRQQMANALLAASRSLKNGDSEAQAMREVKTFASFSGPMRANLIAMLDAIGVNQWLRIATTGSLWEADAPRVQFTSVLRYPVFVNGANYSGAPAPISSPFLRRQLLTWFTTELALLPHAVFVPLGPAVDEALRVAAREVGFDCRRVLSSLPHPSGANAERIAFFLGRKRREALSSKVDPDKLIAAKQRLDQQVFALAAIQD